MRLITDHPSHQSDIAANYPHPCTLHTCEIATMSHLEPEDRSISLETHESTKGLSDGDAGWGRWEVDIP